MNNLDKQYQNLLQEILDTGIKKEDRTGTGTISVFGRQIRHKMSEGFPLLTTKKMPFRLIVTELLWFLRGETNIKFLVDNNCHIWDGDAYKAYEKWYEHMSKTTPFDVPKKFTQDELIKSISLDKWHADQFGELGPIYGRQWRKWSRKTTREEKITNPGVYETHIDQIANLINDLKTNPDSRRLMVTAWNPAELDQMTLPPCHYGFQVYTRELSLNDRVLEFAKRDLDPSEFRRGGNYGTVIPKERTLEVLNNHNIPKRAISLMWNQRSVDTFLGLPFNIASYGLLLEIIAKAVNMVPDELIGNLGDTHLYLNHLDQAKEQIGREMTWEEQVHWVMKNTDVELENFYITEEVYKETTPKRTRQPYTLPKLAINDEFWNHEYQTIDGWINSMEIGDFQLDGYRSHPHIKATLSN
jgi:thymidylate synthase